MMIQHEDTKSTKFGKLIIETFRVLRAFVVRNLLTGITNAIA